MTQLGHQLLHISDLLSGVSEQFHSIQGGPERAQPITLNINVNLAGNGECLLAPIPLLLSYVLQCCPHSQRHYHWWSDTNHVSRFRIEY